MKKIIFLLLILAAVQNWDKISNVFNPPVDYSTQHEEAVVLYATDWCPYCTRIRQFLEENQISYYEYDIEKSTEGRKQYDDMNGKAIPLLVVNGTIIRGYDPDGVLYVLNNN